MGNTVTWALISFMFTQTGGTGTIVSTQQRYFSESDCNAARDAANAVTVNPSIGFACAPMLGDMMLQIKR